MDRKDILEKLKVTEAEIREKIEQARHQGNEIIKTAQKQARNLESDGELRIKNERDKLFEKAKKNIEEERQRVLKKATVDAEAFKKKAQIKKAKEFFIAKFEESVHV
jgi:vacuolar-type H+-ATPase subunit H